MHLNLFVVLSVDVISRHVRDYHVNMQGNEGQIISECPYEIIISPKIPTKNISEISALASKERSNQKLY